MSLYFKMSLNARGQPQAHGISLESFTAGDLEEAKANLCTDFLTFEQVQPVPQAVYQVVLNKRENKPLGIDIDRSDGVTLLVTSIETGMNPMSDWNKSHPSNIVNLGDRIIEVNGASGDAQKLLLECRRPGEITMRLKRPQGFDDESSKMPTIRIATWNVLAGAYTSLKTYPDVDVSVLPAPRRRAQAAAVLERLNAEVICLQEVDCELEDLGFGSDYDAIIAQRPDGRSDRCVIAWRRDRFERGPLGHREVFFDKKPPPDFLKGVGDPSRYMSGNVGIAVELRVLGDVGKRTIHVATTHLCWEPEKIDVRSWQLDVLYKVVKEELGGHRIVICGDLNIQPGTHEHQYLRHGCKLSSVYADVESTAITNSNTSTTEGGFAAMIDYVWFSPQWFSVRKRLRLPTGKELKARESEARAYNGAALGNKLQSEDGAVPTLLSAGWPSDHLCLAAEFVLTNPGPEQDRFHDWDDFD
jgi:mRNA deadenylase 3'-5' endonuclease subunit Ccr4